MAAERPTLRPVSSDPARDPGERRKQLKARNWAMLLALVAFVVLIYVVAIVRMSGG
jgi:hypothetical protein